MSGATTDQFKQGFSRWATGVTIVTAQSGERVHGMTVSAFTEVSLDPPLLLICADQKSNTLPLIREAGAFAVNVLASHQQALSNRFASKKDEWKRFDGLEYDLGATGAPLLREVVVNFDCRLVGAHEQGDHVICIGQIDDVRHSDREPLLHYRGAYYSLSRS